MYLIVSFIDKEFDNFLFILLKYFLFLNKNDDTNKL